MEVAYFGKQELGEVKTFTRVLGFFLIVAVFIYAVALHLDSGYAEEMQKMHGCSLEIIANQSSGRSIESSCFEYFDVKEYEEAFPIPSPYDVGAVRSIVLKSRRSFIDVERLTTALFFDKNSKLVDVKIEYNPIGSRR